MSNDYRIWKVIDRHLIVLEVKFAAGQIDMPSPLCVLFKTLSRRTHLEY
jgi:hypothetical protein